MRVNIQPNRLCGTINAVGSKSFAHRALIISSLISSNSVEIDGIPPSEDVSATVNCLKLLGVEISEGQTYKIIPPKTFVKSVNFDFGESASTMRFMLPVAMALGISVEYTGRGQLLSRPISPLIELFSKNGIKWENNRISGKLQCGDYEIQAGVSSQFISGMLMALSLLKGRSRLKIIGKAVSSGYIKMTIDVLSAFGVKVSEEDGSFIIDGQGPCSYAGIEKYTVEGDWSNSAFFLVAGAIGGDVIVRGLNPLSTQGDSEILKILRSCGADVSVNGTEIRVKRGKLSAFECDVSDIPDLAPALCVLGAFSHGITRISGAERLKFKESNRLDGILEMLSIAKIKAEYDGNAIKIVGGQPHGGTFYATDHRMAMSEAVLAMYSLGKSVIVGGECVGKSYPNFYKDLILLGGEENVLF